ncbi:hypothetical protein AB4037_26635 [Labrys sp. KB_33_2]|uniref:hypothetical protein n=1 Tax=Labrys sp. KB_33_2 TaxID=3237479 RepID=UPI003F906C87
MDVDTAGEGAGLVGAQHGHGTEIMNGRVQNAASSVASTRVGSGDAVDAMVPLHQG